MKGVKVSSKGLYKIDACIRVSLMVAVKLQKRKEIGVNTVDSRNVLNKEWFYKVPMHLKSINYFTIYHRVILFHNNFFCIAVREDRMPGGRNSGAVYNLYKVKYKKHKKANKTATATNRASPPEKPKEPLPPLPPHLVNGTILKTALTNPSEVRNFSTP